MMRNVFNSGEPMSLQLPQMLRSQGQAHVLLSDEDQMDESGHELTANYNR
jgi:hypothetical protein